MSKVEDEVKDVPENELSFSERVRKGRIEKERVENEKKKAKENELSRIKPDVNVEGQYIVQEQHKNMVEKYEEAAKAVKIDKFKLSFIEKYEEEEAKRLIVEQLGFEPLRPNLWQVVVKVFVRPQDIREITTDEGKKISIYLPETATTSDKFVNCVGLVLAMGPQANRGKFFEESKFMKMIRFFFGKWMEPSIYVTPFRVGDWVVFDRNAGPQINYRGVPVTIIEDKHVRAVVEDPTYVSRY